MSARSLVVLDAPSNLGLRPPAPGRVPGVHRMADALRRTGLIARLGAEDAGRVAPPPYSPALDPETRVRNAVAVRAYAFALAARLGPLAATGQFPLVLGGDCSILLGTLLALRRRGRHGLLFVDGHADFLTPDTSRTGGAAGMDLALATGRGPALLTEFDGPAPLVRDEDVVLLGNRDVADPATYVARELFATSITRYPLDRLRDVGVAPAVGDGLARLQTNRVAGFWIHVDLDVLDSDVMPAVDSPQPGGLAYTELVALLQIALASNLAVGLQVTIFDPDLDPEGRLAHELADVLVAAFGSRPAVRP